MLNPTGSDLLEQLATWSATSPQDAPGLQGLNLLKAALHEAFEQSSLKTLQDLQQWLLKPAPWTDYYKEATPGKLISLLFCISSDLWRAVDSPDGQALVDSKHPLRHELDLVSHLIETSELYQSTVDEPMSDHFVLNALPGQTDSAFSHLSSMQDYIYAPPIEASYEDDLKRGVAKLNGRYARVARLLASAESVDKGELDSYGFDNFLQYFKSGFSDNSLYGLNQNLGAAALQTITENYQFDDIEHFFPALNATQPNILTIDAAQSEAAIEINNSYYAVMNAPMDASQIKMVLRGNLVSVSLDDYDELIVACQASKLGAEPYYESLGYSPVFSYVINAKLDLKSHASTMTLKLISPHVQWLTYHGPQDLKAQVFHPSQARLQQIHPKSYDELKLEMEHMVKSEIVHILKDELNEKSEDTLAHLKRAEGQLQALELDETQYPKYALSRKLTKLEALCQDFQALEGSAKFKHKVVNLSQVIRKILNLPPLKQGVAKFFMELVSPRSKAKAMFSFDKARHRKADKENLAVPVNNAESTQTQRKRKSSSPERDAPERHKPKH